jgi:hypothetical protein
MTRVRKMEPGFFALRQEALKGTIKISYSTLDAQAHLALIFLDDARGPDALGKMSRYEARFERSFHKALKELQRLQALRTEVSDSGIGTVLQNPVSPDPEPPIAPPPEAAESETRNPKSEIRNPSLDGSPASYVEFTQLGANDHVVVYRRTSWSSGAVIGGRPMWTDGHGNRGSHRLRAGGDAGGRNHHPQRRH